MRLKTLFVPVVLGLACAGLFSQETRFPTNVPAGDLNLLSSSEKAAGWELLFNGIDLTGWEVDGRGTWSVRDGVLISENGPSHLFTRDKYQNFELSWHLCTYDVAVPKARFGNSGVFLRTFKTGEAYPKGYEVQVDPYDIKNPTGGIYGMAPGTLLVDRSGHWKPAAFLDVHEGKWIHQRARIEGNHIQVWVNGSQTLDWTDTRNQFGAPGYIALQNHHPTDVVLFTSIKIRKLGD